METILTVKEESMIAVADAVREKSGTSGALSFPNGMVDAINSIETSIAAVEVDNKTIIQDENGVISTAIGGYYADPVPAETLYETNDNIYLTYEEYMGAHTDYKGYFALPNWTPLGEEYIGKHFRVSWTEYAYPDSPEYFQEARADAWFLDGNLIGTICVENREGSEIVAGSIDNATGYLKCMPHIYDSPDAYGNSYITNFRFEIAGSDGGAVPISAEFIPQDIFDGISNAYNRADEAYNRADEAHCRIDVLEQNGGGGASDAASVSFNDEVAQIGATTVQEAIEYLADEAANSTSVQEQIDENNAELLKDINIKTSGFDITATPKNASAYVWENNSCPWSFNEKVIYWDMDNMDIHAAYTDPNSNYDIKKMDYGKRTFKKGHYYACKSVGAVDMRTFAGKYGDRNLPLYYGISTSASLKTSPITDSSICLWYGRDYTCYAFKDITHLLLADNVASEERVSEMISEALGVIENGTY